LGDFGVNAGIVEEMYARWLENPRGVEPTWRAFFEENGSAAPRARPAERAARESDPPPSAVPISSAPPASLERAGAKTASPSAGRVYQLITAYRFLGHLVADIDPLGSRRSVERPRELRLESYGFSEADRDREFPTIDLPGAGVHTLGQIVAWMEETYCRSIGVEFRGIESSEERHWLGERMEASRNRLALEPAAQLHLLRKLTDAETLERFIHSSYAPGTKRFSLEGAESLIPLLDMIIEYGALHGIGELVIGMAHRGRLNVLVNTLETSLREIFYAFEDKDAARYWGRGDVKYHLGFSTDRVTEAGKKVHLTMTFNPSHLEIVCPVVEGRVRAKQERAGDVERRRIVPLLIHGDAAFVGQGVVPETLNLTGLPGYTTGGTIHIIVNNQIGFTTDPADSRSTRYASDIVRMLSVPVFHVNGEDPEAVAQVATLAVEYRQRFGKDVVIDLYCYRRHGHNEGDEPRFTQPLMYRLIDQKPTVRQMYVAELEKLGQVTDAVAAEIVDKSRQRLEAALADVRSRGFSPAQEWMGGVWSGYTGGPESDVPDVETGVARERLVALSERITSIPEGFDAHPKLRQLYAERHRRVAGGLEIDWGTVEMLAYASLLADGAAIRLSGEDVLRGTFSHRHAVLWDQTTGAAHWPLNHLGDVADAPARFEAFNSALSEAGVLGFDFGYSLDSPDKLVLWEAQFGDFLNCAQVIVDQFISSCEDKWLRLSGITLLLPHGYEGQGPEHSSARVERFLQQCAEDNMQVCNLTTPAQLFHVLRRQVLRPWRKPLVVFTPKSLLRAAFTQKGPKPTSTVEDLATGRFHRAIADREVDPAAVRKVLLCTGKLYYDLARRRFAEAVTDVAIVRLEQLYPLNHEIVEALAGYRDGVPLVWVQEEPHNYGGWYYVHATLPDVIGTRLPLRCVAREPSASPATGSLASHKLEQERLCDEAFA
jgi:2-oxoglutarate dehydrogenase E1 component